MQTASQAIEADCGVRLPFPVIAALLGYGIALFAPPLLNDGDTYWHIATGEWVLRNGTVPHIDPFSYTLAGSPWVAHEWLSDVLMALAYKAGAWDGVVMLFGVAIALTFGLLAHHLTRWLSQPAALTVLVLGAACISPSLLARPHMLALPALALWTVGLLQARRKGTAPSVLLLPLMAIWANLHGSFIFGLALVLPFAAEAVVEAGAARVRIAGRWGLFIVAAIGAALLTPHGWHGLLFPFQLLHMRQLASINEWGPTDFSTLQPLEIALVALLYIAFSRGVRIPPLRLLTLLGLLHLALQHSRHQMLAGMLGTLILAEPLGQAFGRRAYEGAGRPAGRWIVGGVAFAMLLTVIRVAYPLARADDPVSPITALHQVPAEIARQPVFNDYGFGGYLIFENVKPFIDGRADMYGDDFISAYTTAMAANGRAFELMVERYGIRWTILRAGSPALAMLDTLPGWRRLYADDIAVVHIRAGSGR
jgi:hypothetical protein